MSASVMSANGSVTARSLLRRWLLPVLRVDDIRAPFGNPSHSFLQDNARIHTAKFMLSCFEQYDILLESYPPYSPNLDPIEQAWVLLKRQVQIDYPRLATTLVVPSLNSSSLLGEDSSRSRLGGSQCLTKCRQSSGQRGGTPPTNFCNILFF